MSHSERPCFLKDADRRHHARLNLEDMKREVTCFPYAGFVRRQHQDKRDRCIAAARTFSGRNKGKVD